jgi:hypothetical protein
MQPSWDDVHSYLEYFGTLSEAQFAEVEGKALAAVRRNGEWRIVAAGEDRRAVSHRLDALGIDGEVVVFDRVPPPQFTWNGDEPA